MKKSKKHNERGAGRKPLPEGEAKTERETCCFRPAEHEVFVATALRLGVSRSCLLRSGLRALVIPIGAD